MSHHLRKSMWNAHTVQFHYCTGIGDREWLYASTFDIELPRDNEEVELEFQGLDTFCDVYLVRGASYPERSEVARSHLPL